MKEASRESDLLIVAALGGNVEKHMAVDCPLGPGKQKSAAASRPLMIWLISQSREQGAEHWSAEYLYTFVGMCYP